MIKKKCTKKIFKKNSLKNKTKKKTLKNSTKPSRSGRPEGRPVETGDVILKWSLKRNQSSSTDDRQTSL